MPFLLENLHVFLLSERISNEIWTTVNEWPSFEKHGLGKQLTAAVDSISANIAEGYGRFFIKENIKFCLYARGSLLETKSWLRKAVQRKLITEERFLYFITQIDLVHKKLNGYMKVLKANMHNQTPPDKQVSQ
ncbi:MAG: four helix bundle protein [Sediminibacterium sp.]|nr:four helix bundle protein [Sediminibacterium sp.]